MPNVSSFGAQTDNAVVSGTVTDRQMIVPEVPPQGLMSVGPRQTPNFIKEPWNAQTSYVFYDVVKDSAGSSYVATKPVVPAGTALTDEEFWFKWSDPDEQLNDLQEIVKLYDTRINQNASAIENVKNQNASAIENVKKRTFYQTEINKCVFFGDSVTYGDLGAIGGVQQGRADNPYPAVYGQISGITVVNLARGGATASSESGNSLSQQRAGVNFADYDQMFICFGQNDYTYNSTIGTIFSTDEATFCGAINNAITAAYNANKNIQIVLGTPFYAHSIYDTQSNGYTSKNITGHSVYEYITAIRALGERHKIPVVNFGESLGINQQNAELFINDDVHPNQKGYTKIGTWLARNMPFTTAESALTATGYHRSSSNFVLGSDFESNAKVTQLINYAGDGFENGANLLVQSNTIASKRTYHLIKGRVYTIGFTLQQSPDGAIKIKVGSDLVARIANTNTTADFKLQFCPKTSGDYAITFEGEGGTSYIANIYMCNGVMASYSNPNSAYINRKFAPGDISEKVSNYESPFYFVVDNASIVHIMGAITVNGALSTSDVIGKIPKPFAPKQTETLIAHDEQKTTLFIFVNANGEITTNSNKSSGQIYFDCSYSCEKQQTLEACPIKANPSA